MPWWPCAGCRRRGDRQSGRREFILHLGQTLIRHAASSSTVAAISLGVHGTSPRSCLIAAPSFPLPLAAGVLRACSEAVRMASIAPSTNEDLTAAARAKKHPANRVIGTSASPTRRIPGISVWLLKQCSALRQARTMQSWLGRLSQHSAAERLCGVETPCGYVDNARALPTYPQVQQQQPASIR